MNNTANIGDESVTYNKLTANYVKLKLHRILYWADKLYVKQTRTQYLGTFNIHPFLPSYYMPKGLGLTWKSFCVFTYILLYTMRMSRNDEKNIYSVPAQHFQNVLTSLNQIAFSRLCMRIIRWSGLHWNLLLAGGSANIYYIFCAL